MTTVTRSDPTNQHQDEQLEGQETWPMFGRLGAWVVRHPVIVICTWLIVISALTGVTVLATFQHWSVTASSQADFLPDRYESAQAQDIADKAFPGPDGVTAQLVLTRNDGGQLTTDDVREATELIAKVDDRAPAKLDNGLDNPLVDVQLDPNTLSPNHKVVIGQALFDQPYVSPDVVTSTKWLRSETEEALAGTDLRISYAGQAAAAVDTQKEAQLVQYGMMIVITLLLLFIFRSLVIALVTTLTVALVAGGAAGLLTLAAHVLGVKLDESVTGLLPVVILGVGVDYVVFLLLRYKERLRLGEDRRTAMAASVRRVGTAITSSAFAVIVSFSALLLSQLTSFRILGPALGVAVLFMLCSGLTLMPAVFVLVGRRFARRAALQPGGPKVSGHVGNAVSRHPLATAAVAVAIMALPVLAVADYQPNYELNPYPEGSESARSLDELATGYPVGALAPAETYLVSSGRHLDQDELAAFGSRLSEVRGVGAVQPPQISADGRTAMVPVLLADEPGSTTAMATVEKRLRSVAAKAAPPDTEVAVGGPTSALVDVRTALEPDMRLIFPVAGLLIALILILMLRSLVAPLYLMGGVVLGFLATLGAAVLLFQHIQGESGVSFQLPLVVYLFVASIGTDYNILMISRLREEILGGASEREAARRAIMHAGPTVAAAGLILAGSFGTLMLSTLLQQIGFAVAFGVLVSAFVMSVLLIPGLTVVLGRVAWWPRPPKGPQRVSPPQERPLAPVP
jgi:RND superfamily putative drug exporter